MPTCRFCKHPLSDIIIDLGTSPLANSYVPLDKYGEYEPFYPLRVWLCPECGLAQLEQYSTPDNIFSDYAYYSSFSASWVAHAKKYVDHMIDDFDLKPWQQVVEIASNDGYLLQFFKQRGFEPIGVDPAANIAKTAEEKGIKTEVAFFGAEKAREMAARGIQADLMLGNNVVAHVPDVNDLIEGFNILLKPNGFMTLEFPHLYNLHRETQFDTIYHEHFSYYSLASIQKILEAHGLRVFRVEELPTHGGSLRIFACKDTYNRTVQDSVANVLQKEGHLDNVASWSDFSGRVLKIKLDLVDFLIKAKRDGKKVMGYGAAAKGNTLLNYAGVRPDLLEAVADDNIYKQGSLLPGSRIPIISREELLAAKPDYILILPWNLSAELSSQMAEAREWGCQFVTAVPELKII